MNEARVSKAGLQPVRKSITVNRPVADAFRLFTERIHTWWPLASHSVGEDQTETCILEGKEGGRLYEIRKDGSEADWGRILVWDPPRRFVTSWHPGRESMTAQEVEITFTSEGAGTRLELVHRGWELLGARAEEVREGYLRGWDYVLGLYVDRSANHERLLEGE